MTLQEEKRAKAIKIRQSFISLLESHPEVNSSTRYRYLNLCSFTYMRLVIIKFYFTFRKACEILSDKVAFKAVEDDRLREEIFSEYIYDLRKQEKVNNLTNFIIL